MTRESNGTKSWLMGSLFAVVLLVGGWVRAGDLERIKTADERAQHADERAQRIEVQFSALQQDMAYMKEKLDRIETFQKASDDKLGALLMSIDRNSSRWQQSLQEYGRQTQEYQRALDNLRRGRN